MGAMDPRDHMPPIPTLHWALECLPPTAVPHAPAPSLWSQVLPHCCFWCIPIAPCAPLMFLLASLPPLLHCMQPCCSLCPSSHYTAHLPLLLPMPSCCTTCLGTLTHPLLPSHETSPLYHSTWASWVVGSPGWMAGTRIANCMQSNGHQLDKHT